MSSTTQSATREVLTVTCPECDAEMGVEMAGSVEVTDRAPDGIIEATCRRCDEHFAVGFSRTAE